MSREITPKTTAKSRPLTAEVSSTLTAPGHDAIAEASERSRIDPGTSTGSRVSPMGDTRAKNRAGSGMTNPTTSPVTADRRSDRRRLAPGGFHAGDDSAYDPRTVPRVTTFVLVGTGFRAQMFLDVARALGTVRCAGAVVRTPRSLEVPTFASLDACVRELRPDFVLTTTPRSVTPGVIADAVDRGVPVLAETPPAPDLDGLRALWSAVGASGLVQVAEQYLMMPSHAARAALVASGAIGTPTQVQVSSTQQYHAVSLIRGLLGAGRGPVSVRASRFTAPLVSPLGRAGWTDDEEAHPTTTTIATLDFGDGRSGSTTSPSSRPATSCGSGG